MTGQIYTDTELAEEFGIELKKFHELRRRRNWPCVKFGRFDVRFTEAQREAILRSQTETERPKAKGGPKAGPIKGLTTRSAARAKT